MGLCSGCAIPSFDDSIADFTYSQVPRIFVATTNHARVVLVLAIRNINFQISSHISVVA